MRALLHGSEQAVRGEGQERGRDRPRQDETRVHGGQAAEDVGAEASGADGRGDGGGAYRHDRGDAHAGQDHGQGEGQLDQAQPLARRHAHPGRRLEHRGVDLLDAGHGVAQDGKERIEHERHDGRAHADAADERHRDQEAEEGEARDGLGEVGEGQDGPREARAAGEGDAEGDADRHRDACGDEDQQDVLAGQEQQLRAALGEEPQQAHARSITAAQRR